MATPEIYISFGMAKSGSTLGFRLVTAILEEAGVPQLDLSFGRDNARFYELIRPQELHDLRVMATKRPQNPIAVKTHSGLWDCVAKGLDEGWIIGHATCRDPRDIALSMMDASRRNDGWGRKNGEPLRHVEDALDYVRAHIAKFEKWAEHQGILPLTYEPLAFATEQEAERIAAQLGVKIDPRRCVKAARLMGTNMNLGKPRRHEREMGAEISARIEAEFSDFITRWCQPDFVAPKRSFFSRLLQR